MKLATLLLACLLALAPIARAADGLDLNTATVSELDKLPGIGRSKAEAIVRFREANGPFKSIEELRQLKGFGAATVAKLEGLVRVGGAVAAPAKKAPPRDDAEMSLSMPSGKTTARPAPPAADSSALDREPPAGKLNLNLATEDELQELDGVSRANAKLILGWRKVKGPFRTIGDLARVPGLPAGLYDKVQYFVVAKMDPAETLEPDLVALGVSSAGARAVLTAQRKKPLKAAKQLDGVAGLSEPDRSLLGDVLWFAP